MSNNWQTKKLGEICEMINRGISPKYTTIGGVCVLNQKCIRDHKINFDLSRLHDFNNKRVSSDKFIQIGDVLVNSTGTGTLGRVASVKELPFEATVDSHVTIVRPIKNMFYRPFFGYALIFIEEEISKRGDGCGGQTELARTTLKNDFEITYPESLTEQRRIVTILDKAFAAIDKAKSNAEQNIKNTKELFDRHLQVIFNPNIKGWTEEKMNALFKIKHGFAFKGKYFTTDFEGKDPIVLTPGNYSEEGGLYFTEKNTKRYHSKYLPEFLFQKGDVTIVMTDLSSKMKILGKPAIIEVDNILHNQRIGKFGFLSNKIDKSFLYYFLMSNKFIENIKSTSTGTMVKHTAPGRILSNLISYPPSIKQQKEIVQSIIKFREDLDKVKNIYQIKLKHIENLKKSILQKAFSGELTTENINLNTQVHV